MQPSHRDSPGSGNGTWAILLISILGLFLQMLLIRWIGTEIRIFAYLQNTILVVCFLGLGLGCFTCRRPVLPRQALVPLVILVALLAVPLTNEGLGRISDFLSLLEDFVIWGQLEDSLTGGQVLGIGTWQKGLLVVFGLFMTYVVMVLVLDMFIPVGRLLGRLMDDHPNTVWAYSVNVAGSLVGIWLFVLLSFLHQPPFTWFLVLGALAFPFIWTSLGGRAANLALLGAAVILSVFAGSVPGSMQVVWSPYQKLVLERADREKGGAGEYVIRVNNTGYQVISDLRNPNIASDPVLYPLRMRGLSQYDIPLLLHPDPMSYLVVGAGAGNDAAAGLRHGVKEITAVEIDPAIISLGKAYHPEGPYVSSAVRIMRDDARSFFSVTEEKFDVISFGLLDSHTTTAMTNARLDHYVYTRESISRARSLLRDGGVMVLTFEAQKPYIADRMARVLHEVFGDEPLAFRIPMSGFGWGGVMFVTGDLAAARRQIAHNPELADLISVWDRASPLNLAYATKVATDDWPYIYLESPRIPSIYYLLTGVMFLLLVRSYRRWGATGAIGRWTRSHWHFFFLGAGFLLLEVQNISKASVVLGNTWQVNAVIVSGVMGMILLANLLAHRFPRIPSVVAYVGLLGACLALYFLDLASLAFLPYALKTIVVGALTTLPILFSGIVFIRSFAAAVSKHEALGANLIGALVGALLQSVTFVTGIKSLLLIVAGLYLLSFLVEPGRRQKVNTQLLTAQAG